MGGKRSSSDPFAGAGLFEPRGMCHASHPDLKLGNGVLVGASGYEPRKGFDVYVHLGAARVGADTMPWETPVRINYGITDRSVPSQPGRFKKLVTYLCNQLQAGKRVHVGCFGGHGRTGLVLAAVYKELTGDANAIQWVRANHCEKAVESQSQIDFLVANYGTTKAAPSKGHGTLLFGNDDPFSGPREHTKGGTMGIHEYVRMLEAGKKSVAPAKAGVYVPTPGSKKCVWR